jgi:hypothetical protein
MKSLLFCLGFLLFASTPLDAQWIFWGQKHNWGCCRFIDPTLATYDYGFYGYIDNINYPDTYELPINRCFNYCPPCSNSYNYRYLQNCIQYTRQVNRGH